MPVNNVAERQEEFIEQRPVSCCCQVAIKGMEHPESRINGVVLGGLSTVRETVGNESRVGVGGKCFEQAARLLIPPCTEEQSRQRNHAVPSPVGEPGITGNDRLQVSGALAFPLPAIWLAAPRVGRAGDDKLIGGNCQAGKYRISLGQGIL